MIIYNCHTHLFTMKHLPYWYFFGLAHAMRPKIIRKPLMWILHNILPFSNNDQLDRLAKYAETGFKKTQADIFRELDGNYPHNPPKARFVVLPMDMGGMGYGKASDGINSQLEELATLSQKTDGRVLPFVHIDPRRPNALDCIKYWIEVRKFKGVKIYPNFGYRPDGNYLKPIYEYCEEQDLPVMTHCSGATFRAKHYLFDRDRVTRFNSPLNYVTVLDRYPGLRLCLGHFGGEKAWDAFMRDPLGNAKYKNEPTKDWLKIIREMLDNYSNLYTDISYTMFDCEANIGALNILLEKDAIRQKTLFGSDYYMSKVEKITEREHCFRVRNGIGSELFAQLAESNATRYLGARAGDLALAGSGLPPAPVPQDPDEWPYA